MKKLACVASVLAILAASSLAASDEQETPTIKDVMQKLHKGANSPLAKLKTASKADSPDWKSIQGITKDFEKFGAYLTKNDPPKGEKAEYKKLADDYYKNAKALNDSAKEENKTDLQAAFKKVSSSCAACHKAHKPD